MTNPTEAVELTREWVEMHAELAEKAGKADITIAADDYAALCRSWLARQDEERGWQPLATAPDGERIIAYWPSDNSIETVTWDRKWFEEVSDMPTCWQPLPAPPSPKEPPQ